MADDVIKRGVIVLADHSNESKDKKKQYRTIYGFVPGPNKGFDRPEVFEMSVEHEDQFVELCKLRNKQVDMVIQKTIYNDGGVRLQFVDFLQNFMKAS